MGSARFDPISHCWFGSIDVGGKEMTILSIFYLLIVFQIKHLVADYYLQGRYMLGKFNKVGWAKPLAAHCGVHAAATFLILGVYGVWVGYAIALSLFDFVLHFIIDRAKVKVSEGYTPSEAKFWHFLGCDQLLHHITHYIIIFIVVLLV